MSDKKHAFLNRVADSTMKLFYFDRKEDEEVNCNDVESLIDSGTVSLREVVEAFQNEIIKNYPGRFKDEFEMGYMFKPMPHPPIWSFGSMPPPPLQTIKDCPAFTPKK